MKRQLTEADYWAEWDRIDTTLTDLMLNKATSEERHKVTRHYMDLGWSNTYHPFDPRVTPEERRTFEKSLVYSKREDFRRGLGLLLRGYGKTIDRQYENLKQRRNRLTDLIDSNPVSLFTGRDFRGLQKNHAANLKLAFDSLGSEIYKTLAEWIKEDGKHKARERDNVGAAVHMWMLERCHTYFIGDELMESLLDTDVGGDFSLTELRWPLNAFAVIFPKPVKTALQETDGSVTDRDIIGVVMSNDPSEEVVTAETTCARLLGWKIDQEETLRFPSGPPYVTLLGDKEVFPVAAGDGVGTEMKAFLFSMLYVWVEKPELIERGHRLGDKVSRKPGSKPAWSPNYIGRSYKIPVRDDTEPSGNDGRRVRRKVRGHFKHQPYGKGWSLRKRIFIEPYWAGTIEI